MRALYVCPVLHECECVVERGCLRLYEAMLGDVKEGCFPNKLRP